MMPRPGRATHRSTGALALLAALLLLPGPAEPQEPQATASPLIVGSRIRLRAPTLVDGRIEGIVAEMDETSILVSINDRVPLRVPRQAITQLDLSTGRHRQVAKGMLIGAGIGVAAFAVTLISWEDSSSEDFAQGLAMGALGGAIWGAGIGALIKSDRWSALPLERVRVSVAPAPGHGVHLSLSVRF